MLESQRCWGQSPRETSTHKRTVEVLGDNGQLSQIVPGDKELLLDMRGDKRVGPDEFCACFDVQVNVSIERHNRAVGSSKSDGTGKRFDGRCEGSVLEQLVRNHRAGGTSIRQSLTFIGN